MRRLLRFLSLPYCYFVLVDWNRCEQSRLRVAGDLLYIFFVLKYFPDNYSQCRLWKQDRAAWLYYYGSNYEPFQRHRLRRHVQPKEYEILYEDKLVCNTLCRAHCLPTPEDLCVAPPTKDLESWLLNHLRTLPVGETVIAKPITGKAGHEILLFRHTGTSPRLCDAKGIPIDSQFHSNVPYLMQTRIRQAASLNKFAPSLNTVRIVTLLLPDEEVKVLGAYLKFGTARTYIDNMSRGGLSVPIDRLSGRLAAHARDRSGDLYVAHPTSGLAFSGFEVPCWQALVELVVRAQRALPFHKLLGFDIGVTDGGPVIIEINSIYDNVDLEQQCGPILRDQATLRAFGDYGLLINRRQKNLFKSIDQ